MEPVADNESPTGADGQIDGRVNYESALDDAERVLDGVDRALSRLDDGTYGSCELCGEGIEDPRLDRDPAATRCGRHLDLSRMD